LTEEDRVPERRLSALLRTLNSDAILSAAVFLISFLHLIQFCGSLDVRGIADEGYSLDVVQRMFYGELIYKDFFVAQTPLSVIILRYLVFPVFGTTLLAARASIAFIGGAMAALTYKMARSLGMHWLLALYPPFLFVFFGFHNWNNVSHHWFSMLFVLLGIYLLQSNILKPSRAYKLFLSGICGGLAFLSLQSDGFLFLASIAVFLPLRKMTFWETVRDVFLFGLGIAFSLSVFLIFLFLNARTFPGYTSYLSLLKTIFYNCMILPFGEYNRFNALPQYYYFGNQIIADLFHSMVSPASFKEFLFSLFGLPVAASFGYAPFPALIFSAIYLYPRRNNLNKKTQGLLLLSVICLVFILGAILTRPDPLRLIFISPVTFALFFLFLEKGLLISSPPPLARGGIKGGIFSVKLICSLLFFIFGVATIVWGASWAYSLSKYHRIEVKVPRGTIVFSDPIKAAELSSLNRFINSKTKEGDYLYIHGWSPQYYFLLNRRNPTSYDLLIPVLYSHSQIEDAVSQIEAKKPRYVLYDGKVESLMQDPAKNTFPTLTPDDLKDNPMVPYIHSHYKPVMSFLSLGLAILERRSP